MAGAIESRAWVDAAPSRGIHTLSGKMCQHDFEGKRVFQHRNGRKWSMYDNPQVPGSCLEAECVRFIDELELDWSPATQTPPTGVNRTVIAAMDGQRFECHRVDHDHRPMMFRGDGTFAVDGVGCERYWTIRAGRLMIAGNDGRLTMPVPSDRGKRP